MITYAGRYERLKLLGKGAGGEVVLAKDNRTGLNYALKLLKTTFGRVNKSSIEDFKSEFKILKKLNHPYIAKVYDAGFDDEFNRFFIVTEFIDGCDLYKFTENQPLHQIESLFIQALRAFNYLHSQKIYHLDIKPQNLLVTKWDTDNFQIKVIDFGFANFYSRRNLNDDDLVIIGTATYTPPEIILGKEPDGRADLYSLACAFYKAFTRETPFKGASPEEFHQKHLESKPSSLVFHNSEIPEYINQVILKLLEKDPSDRYPTAQSVIEDINLLSGKFYPIETPETMMSYIPEKGDLIGREKQFEKFMEVFNDRIKYKTFRHKNYLVVSGPEGSGKTRFINECKSFAQQQFIPSVSWDESGEMQPEDFPEKCLVLGDDADVTHDDLEYMDLIFKENAILTVLSSSDPDFSCDPDSQIKITPFDKTLTKLFLEKATGLSEVPSHIVDIIYSHTQGNPLYLTEYVRALFQKGFFRDSQGGWTASILEDLGSELETLSTHDFISKSLSEKISQLDIKEDQWHILNMMALTGKPTLADLEEITNGEYIEEQLEFFVQKGILTTDPDYRYVFSNPIFKEIIIGKIDPEMKAEYCDSIANYLETQNAEKEKILYFRGLGAYSNAHLSLLELYEIQLKKLLFQEAQKTLEEIFYKLGVPVSDKNKACLLLSEMSIEATKYDEAYSWLGKIDVDEQSSVSDFILTKIEYTGVCLYQQGKIDEAKQQFLQGVDQASSDQKYLPNLIRCKNRLARLLFDSGNLEEALKIFLSNWEIWSEKLENEDKIKAIRSDIGAVFYAQGKYNEALQFLEKQFETIKDLPHHPFFSILNIHRARCYEQLDDFHKAETLFLENLELLRRKKLPSWMYIVYCDLGRLYGVKKDYQKALDAYVHSFQLSQKSSMKNHNVMAAYNIGTTNLILEQFSEAKKFFSYVVHFVEDKKMLNDYHFGYHYFLALIGLSASLRQLDNIEESKVYLKKAQVYFNDVSFLNEFEIYFLKEQAFHLKEEQKEDELSALLQKIESIYTDKNSNMESFASWKKQFENSGS